jgi:hypothetical protein
MMIEHFLFFLFFYFLFRWYSNDFLVSNKEKIFINASLLSSFKYKKINLETRYHLIKFFFVFYLIKIFG